MYIDENIEVLQKNPYHWIAELNESKIKYTYLATDTGIDYFQDGLGQVLKSEDIFDEQVEITPLTRQMVIAIGCLSSKELSKLYKKLNATSVLVVIEPNVELFNYALVNKKMSVFNNANAYLFADGDLQNIQPFITTVLQNFNYYSLVNNITFYLTDFYRQYDAQIVKEIVQILRNTIRSRLQSTGNSIEDGLTGLENNMRNIEYLLNSKDPQAIYQKYKGKPAIVIAAGPSLNKNIQHLHKAVGKAVIIAVDTIAQKVIKMGIIPDFVTSVERVPEIYEYFYKNYEFPKETTLVGPSLLDTRVFQEYNSEQILPFRTEVSEYRWLQNMLGITGNVGMLMGSSCAHVAFGIAAYVGANPIILIGQDLAYGQDEEDTHVSDTIYDELKKEKKSRVKQITHYIEGYYEEEVKSTDIWIMFKQWFEIQADKLNVDVINSTEGGAKIAHTIQMPFDKAIEKYCVTPVERPIQLIEKASTYNVPLNTAIENFENELTFFNKIETDAREMMTQLQELEINAVTLKKKYPHIREMLDIFNRLVERITANPLLLHNMQGIILKTSWDFSLIDDVISVENLTVERAMQVKFMIVVISTVQKITAIIEPALEKLRSRVDN